jgi:tetratricopeptide (TPR) repeat protein
MTESRQDNRSGHRTWLTAAVLGVLAVVILGLAIWVATRSDRDVTDSTAAGRRQADEITPERLRSAVQTQLKLGRKAEALEMLQKYLATEPSDVETWVLAGEVLLEMDRPAEAEKTAERLLARHGEHPKLLWLKGLAQAEQGKATSEKWLSAAAEKPGAPAGMVGAYGRRLIARQQIASGARYLRRSYQAGDRHPGTLMRLGQLALREEDWDKAEAYLTEAVQYAPESLDAHVMLAEALRASGQQARRERIVLQAVTLARSPRQRASLRMTLGQLRELQQRWSDAAEAYTKAATWDPIRGEALYSAALCYYEAGTYARAMGAIDEAIELMGPGEQLAALAEKIEIARFGPAKVKPESRDWFEGAPSLKTPGQEASEDDEEDDGSTPALDSLRLP